MLFSISIILPLLATVRITCEEIEKRDPTVPDELDDPIFPARLGSSDSFVKATGEKSNGSACSVATHSCVSLFKCDDLLRMYEKRDSTSEERSTLRNRFCGWIRGAPNVCCEVPKRTFRKCGDTLPRTSIQKILRDPFPVTPDDWPWMAALFSSFGESGVPKFKCAGSLIANEWVLTAAHCIPAASNSSEKLMHVVLGDSNLNKTVADMADPIEVNIAEVIKHPQYKEKPVLNDIALLRLSTPVTYNTHIQPICLHGGSDYLDDTFYNRKKPTIAGWGYTSKEGEYNDDGSFKYQVHVIRNPLQCGKVKIGENFLPHDHLLETDIPMVNTTKCRQNYATYSSVIIDQATVLCAGNGIRMDPCPANSGGPLMFKNYATRVWSQGGILSFGKRCGEKDFPSVYTRVAAFTDWIRNATNLEF